MNLSAFAKDPTKHSDRTGQLNELAYDIKTIIISLQKEVESLNARIEDLKRMREMVRTMKKEAEQ